MDEGLKLAFLSNVTTTLDGVEMTGFDSNKATHRIGATPITN